MSNVRYVCPECGYEDGFVVISKIGVLIKGDGRILDVATAHGCLEVGPDFPMGCMSCDCRGPAKNFIIMEDDSHE